MGVFVFWCFGVFVFWYENTKTPKYQNAISPFAQKIMSDDRSGKLVIVFMVALLLLNYPLIGLVDKKELLVGLPKLYLYLFIVWVAIILAIRQIVNSKNK